MSVIATLTFRLVAGADEAAFLSADARLQVEVYYGQPGLLRRTTARGGDGEWLVVTLWRSADDAATGAERARDHPLTAEFLAHLDATSMRVGRYETPD
jgi:heme-degrading monooxygenase HmoA